MSQYTHVTINPCHNQPMPTNKGAEDVFGGRVVAPRLVRGVVGRAPVNTQNGSHGLVLPHTDGEQFN